MKTLDSLVKSTVSIANNTMKAKIEADSELQFDEKAFLETELGLKPSFDYKSKFEDRSEKEDSITTKNVL